MVEIDNPRKGYFLRHGIEEYENMKDLPMSGPRLGLCRRSAPCQPGM
jgi:hypothetical protein